MAKKKEITIDDLGRMMIENHDEIKQEFTVVHTELKDVKKRLTLVEQGQDDIKLRLDNVAYRFELNDLNKRVTVLEKKASFSK